MPDKNAQVATNSMDANWNMEVPPHIRKTMNTHEHATEISTGLIKIAPPVYVAGTSITGMIDWQMWVYIVTFFYVCAQFGQFAWEKWIKPNVKRRR